MGFPTRLRCGENGRTARVLFALSALAFLTLASQTHSAGAPPCRIPPATAAKLSPYLQARAIWPADSALRAIPPPLPPTSKPDPKAQALQDRAAQLKNYVRRLLALPVAPQDWDTSFRQDKDGNVFCLLGARGGFAEGLATTGTVNGSECFSFYLRYRTRVAKVDLRSLSFTIRDVFSRDVADALTISDNLPRPDPVVNGPLEFAATAALGPDRLGMQWDFLYLYQSQDCFVGVFQSIPERTAPGNGP